jgi:CheY-like chemotaxis protein
MMTAPTILVVDDRAADRDTMAALLRNNGYQPTAVKNAQEALEQLVESPPRLVLLDMLMADSDGWDFLQERKYIPGASDIPVIIVTGLAIGGEEWARGLGAVDLVRKPINPDDLLQKVHDAMG